MGTLSMGHTGTRHTENAAQGHTQVMIPVPTLGARPDWGVCFSLRLPLCLLAHALSLK